MRTQDCIADHLPVRIRELDVGVKRRTDPGAHLPLPHHELERFLHAFQHAQLLARVQILQENVDERGETLGGRCGQHPPCLLCEHRQAHECKVGGTGVERAQQSRLEARRKRGELLI